MSATTSSDDGARSFEAGDRFEQFFDFVDFVIEKHHVTFRIDRRRAHMQMSSSPCFGHGNGTLDELDAVHAIVASHIIVAGRL